MAGPQTRKIWAINIVNMDRRLSDKAKLVFARLTDRFNVSRGYCFPGEKLMAAELGCTDRTIRTAITLLKDSGYIKVQRKRGPNGSNLYEVWLPSGKPEYEEAEKKCVQMRKSSSAKTLKENIKKTKKRVEREKAELKGLTQGPRDISEKEATRAAIERAFVRSQPDAETGYGLLLRLGDDRLTEITKTICRGRGSTDDALAMIHDALDNEVGDE